MRMYKYGVNLNPNTISSYFSTEHNKILQILILINVVVIPLGRICILVWYSSGGRHNLCSLVGEATSLVSGVFFLHRC